MMLTILKNFVKLVAPKFWSALAILALIYLITYPDQIVEGLSAPDFAFTKMLTALVLFIVATYQAGGFRHDEVKP